MKITRREAIKVGGACLLGAGGFKFLRDYTNIFSDELYPFVLPMSKWGFVQFTDFLSHLNQEQQILVSSSMGKGNEQFNVSQIKRDLMWISSNPVSYVISDAVNYDYHSEILMWLAEEFQVPQQYRSNQSSFFLERKIMDSVFVKLWDRLSVDQRRHVLEKLDSANNLPDKIGLASLGGASALAALITTQYFAGFAFYTGMSGFICTTAGLLGITLPFAAYTGASTTVGILTGPVGWALLGIAAFGSVMLLGRADAEKAVAFVSQVHLIKVHSLKNSHRLESTLSRLDL